jgi:hypothetical protein
VMGCGGGKADKFDDILAQLTKFKTEMCACRDAACADKVSEARRDYKKTMRDQLDKNAKPSADQDKQGKQIEADLQACRKALMPADEMRPETPE